MSKFTFNEQIEKRVLEPKSHSQHQRQPLTPPLVPPITSAQERDTDRGGGAKLTAYITREVARHGTSLTPPQTYKW